MPEKYYSTYLYSVQTLHLHLDTYASIILWRDKYTLNRPDSIYGIYGQRFCFSLYHSYFVHWTNSVRVLNRISQA